MLSDLPRWFFPVQVTPCAEPSTNQKHRLRISERLRK
ncbi:hypothetical protein OIU74_017587 [Salix koriyanagi]|uniref:Uncharacterized protein n=1 Tax=Salix koriyanagi TaxID=2511006 RepID=A0A9Q0WQ44_9ROSI|nr:hypothetical protein OIU74_017587 [Salix koriyanagi]KAJ6771184.1 hypothetical protein OIU74_017587 [Salix koriyanagi]KAJ6771185.1 hypothetical protein OIU74_017587 [Salix koriyanagi]KAJ6771186.1 hypothetical protein OIU74_017587 [Salix koriyanagi]